MQFLNTLRRRGPALLLAVLMCMSMLPVSALAAGRVASSTYAITIGHNAIQTLTGQTGYNDTWTSSNDRIVSVAPNSSNPSEGILQGQGKTQINPVTVTHTYQNYMGIEETETWDVYVTNDTTTVYVYVKLTGATPEGWTSNKSGWYTIGTINVPRSMLCLSTEVSENKNNYTERIYHITTEFPFYYYVYWKKIDLKPFLNVDALARHADNISCNFDFNTVSWEYQGTIDSSSQTGLHTASGADGYSSAPNPAWHLDGLLNIKNKNFNLTINYVYDQNCTSQTGTPADSHTESLRQGGSYNVRSPKVEGYIPSLDIVKGNIWEDTTINVVYHRDANNNGKPDCQEQYTGTVELPGWTYDGGTVKHNPNPTVTAVSPSGANFGEYDVVYTYKKVNEDGSKEDLDTQQPVNVGNYTVTATISSKLIHKTITTEPVSFSIAQRPVTLNAKGDEKPFDGTELTPPSPGYEVVAPSVDTGLIDGHSIAEGVTVSGSITKVGSTQSVIQENTVKIMSGSNDVTANYKITCTPGTLTVNDRNGTKPDDKKYELTIKAASKEGKYSGKPQSVSGFDFSHDDHLHPNPDGTITAAIPVGDTSVTYIITGVTVTGASGTDAGEYTSTVNISDAKVYLGTVSNDNDVTNQFNLKGEDGKLNITKRNVTLIAGSTSEPYKYAPLTYHHVDVGGDGFVGDEGFAEYSFTPTSVVTEPNGTAVNRIDYEHCIPKDNTNLNNYSIECKDGQLLRTGIADNAKYQITLTANSRTVDYNGANQEVKGYTAKLTGSQTPVSGSDIVGNSFMIDDEEFTISGNLSASANGKDVHDYISTVTGEIIITNNNTNVTDAFLIEREPGKLIINPLKIDLYANTKDKPYDGTALTISNEEFHLGDGQYFPDGEGVKCTITGSQTLVGSSDSTITKYEPTGTTNLNNYTINKHIGTLTVTERNAKYAITVTAKSDEVVYNGQKRTVNGFSSITYNGETQSVSGINPTFTINGIEYQLSGYTVYGEGTDQGEYDVKVNGTAVIKQVNQIDNTDEEGVVTEQFAVTPKDGTLKIKKRPITLTADSLEKVYDGTALTHEYAEGDGYTVSASGEDTGLVSGHKISSVTFTGSQTLPNETIAEKDRTKNVISDVSISTQGTNDQPSVSVKDNYDITLNSGTLTVINRTTPTDPENPNPKTDQYEVTVTANSYNELYDGQSHTASGFNDQSDVTLSNGKKLEDVVPVTANSLQFYVGGLTSTATGTNAWESIAPIPIQGTEVVYDSEGNEVTEQFIVKKIPGTLNIRKRSVTLTSGSDDKIYDGEALTNNEITVGGDGWVDSENPTYKVTGSQTAVGHSANTFDYEWAEDKEPDLRNYNLNDDGEIPKTEGQLTVKPRNADNLIPITVTAESLSTVYNGSNQSVNGFENETDEGIEVSYGNHTYYVTELSSEASGRNVLDSKDQIPVEGTAKVWDESGEEVTENFNVKIENGSLEIKPRKLTLHSDDLTKEYDGNPLENRNAPLAVEKGWADGEGASYIFTGSRTLVGEATNSFTIVWDSNTNENNYDLDKQEGTLTVTNRNPSSNPDTGFDITLTDTNASFIYDGDPHSVSEERTRNITANGNPYTLTYTLTSEGTITDAGETPITVSDITIRDITGADVTGQFTIHNTSGTLTVTKRPVTLTSGSSEQEYDGDDLTNGSVFVGGSGWANGEGATYSVTGRQSGAGRSQNTFTYDLLEGTNPDNYDIQVVYGILALTEPEDFSRRPGNPDDNTTNINDDRTPTTGGDDLTDITDLETPLADMGLNTTDHYAYLAGFNDGTIRPLNNITRAEVATILFRLMSDNYRTANWATTNSFPDVKPDEWYTTAISTVAKASLMSGDSSGNFRPNDPITRGEFASIAARLASADTVASASFSDTAGHWAESAINTAAGAGWIKGSSGQFRPNAYITRAEAATIVNAMVERHPDKEHLLDTMTVWPDNPETEWYYTAIQEATNTHDYELETQLSESWTKLGEARNWSALMSQWQQAAEQSVPLSNLPVDGLPITGTP